MTHKAQAAAQEIQGLITGIDNKLGWLGEADLKGFVFYADDLSKGDRSRPIWLGAIQLAARFREIYARRRTGRGTWYALLNVMRWDATPHIVETTASFHEKCGSKAEAEEAARATLVEHAKDFNADTTVEAEVLCDLEWDEDGEMRLL